MLLCGEMEYIVKEELTSRLEVMYHHLPGWNSLSLSLFSLPNRLEQCSRALGLRIAGRPLS